MPTIATVAAPDATQAAQALAKLDAAPSPLRPDYAEVRLDALWHDMPSEDDAADGFERILDAGSIPLVATLRPQRQGGAWMGSEPARLNLLAAAGRMGFAAVDLELDVAQTPGLAREVRGPAQQVLSHHQVPVPCRDDGLLALQAMHESGATVDKLVFQAGSFADHLRALELAHAHAQRGGNPAVMTTGSGGPQLRALLAVCGNRATYGHAGHPGHPSQPALSDIEAIWQHWGLTPADLHHGGRWFGALGPNVAHSLSPALHNDALRRANRPERCGSLEVPNSIGALRLVAMVAHRIGLAGASVLAPLKADAARIANPDGIAAAVGAANCLRFDAPATPGGAGTTHATNTDATALRRIAAPHVQPGMAAVVLGSGATARAAVWALRGLGANVTVCSRNEATGRAAAAVHPGAGAATGTATWAPWSERSALRAACWVNATPLGSAPSDEAPVPAAALQGATLVVECNYAAGAPTAFERAASRGARVDGKRLLAEQARDAYRFWTGAEAPTGAYA